MRINIWNKNNELINLSDYGLKSLSLVPEAPSYSTLNETIEGVAGSVRLGKQLNPRNLTARFFAESFDYIDSLIQRDDIYNLLNGDEPFYIGEINQPGKRWLVESSEAWIPNRYNSIAQEITLNLVAHKGFSESVGRSIDPQTFDSELWQIGQGLLLEDAIYEHNTTNFEIYNAGNISIDPRNMNMEIEIIIKADTSNYIELENRTTGEVYRYDGILSANDTLRIKGIRSTKNNLSVFRDTNKRLITLVPGFNEFVVRGASEIESIVFDFRFYYL